MGFPVKEPIGTVRQRRQPKIPMPGIRNNMVFILGSTTASATETPVDFDFIYKGFFPLQHTNLESFPVSQ